MTKKKDEEEAAAAEVEAAAAEEETKPLDETIPGGAYNVGGKLVNAEGEPITKTGKVKE